MLNICDSTGILSNLIHQPVCVHICQSQLSECCHLQSPDRCITVEGKFIFIINQLDMDLFLKDLVKKTGECVDNVATLQLFLLLF